MITVPANAPVYVRIAASIAASAHEYRRGNLSPMDAACRRELSASQTDTVQRAVMSSADPERAAFDSVVAILRPGATE